MLLLNFYAREQALRTGTHTNTHATYKKTKIKSNILSAYKMEDCQQNTDIGDQTNDCNKTEMVWGYENNIGYH